MQASFQANKWQSPGWDSNRDKQTKANWEDAVNKVLSADCDMVAALGDFVDEYPSRENSNATLRENQWTNVTAGLNKLSQEGQNFVLVTGNHETDDKVHSSVLTTLQGEVSTWAAKWGVIKQPTYSYSDKLIKGYIVFPIFSSNLLQQNSAKIPGDAGTGSTTSQRMTTLLQLGEAFKHAKGNNTDLVVISHIPPFTDSSQMHQADVLGFNWGIWDKAARIKMESFVTDSAFGDNKVHVTFICGHLHENMMIHSGKIRVTVTTSASCSTQASVAD